MKTKGTHKMIDRYCFFFIFRFSRGDGARLVCCPPAVGGCTRGLSRDGAGPLRNLRVNVAVTSFWTSL